METRAVTSQSCGLGQPKPGAARVPGRPVRGPGLWPGRQPFGILYLSCMSRMSWIYHGYIFGQFCFVVYLLCIVGTCVCIFLIYFLYMFGLILYLVGIFFSCLFMYLCS